VRREAAVQNSTTKLSRAKYVWRRKDRRCLSTQVLAILFCCPNIDNLIGEEKCIAKGPNLDLRRGPSILAKGPDPSKRKGPSGLARGSQYIQSLKKETSFSTKML
ncbi:hypothetical protein Avbf_10231, partial [Armadillidium vulgare]